MTDIVNPRLVRDMPPAPLDSDPPAVFDAKAKDLALWYPNWVIDNNNQAADNRQNAQATYELAQAADGHADQAQGFAGDAADAVTAVNQTVADILAAKDAIQAGPVASVMGRTGVVTGLAETASPNLGTAAMSTAPVGQWVSFVSTGAAGSDWPTNLGNAWWSVITYGANTRKLQRATQVYAGGQQGWVFERQLHDATWSIWRRVFTDQSLIERVDIRPGMTTGAITIDPATASMHIFALGGNVAANLSSPRGEGDQLTIRIYQTGSHSVTFSSNVVMPVGVTLPLISSGEFLTISLITDNNKTKWFLFVCGKHVG